ncbi:MAG: amine oxidase, partial [Proteobacteria bacterium]
IVTRYQHVPFRELVRSPAIALWDPDQPGDFGGLGMSADESSIFYAIGIGDGSWGAFYDVCSLYPLRTAIFGFSSHLQLVHGRVDGQGKPLSAPFLAEQAVTDSKGVSFAPPRYLGLAALDECLMFMPLKEGARSPYELLREQPAGVITDSPVNSLTRLADGPIEVGYRWHQSDALASRQVKQRFDSVIVTVPSWILETRIQVAGFTPAMLPQPTINAYKTAHWETSCKVYAPLKKTFLQARRDIPQILITDSFVHDVYAYRYNDSYAYDCILLSYTWEDDATKLAAFSDAELVDNCVRELDRILLRCSNVGSRISPFIDTTNARVQRWVTDRNALGCAKLYRAGAYQDAVGLMSYNRDYSSLSGLYFAGESFSVDAGWTEPALRGAVDAAINLCANQGATFNGGFDLSHYPRYGTES